MDRIDFRKDLPKDEVVFYKGACKNKNLFSMLDAKFANQKYRTVENEYLEKEQNNKEERHKK